MVAKGKVSFEADILQYLCVYVRNVGKGIFITGVLCYGAFGATFGVGIYILLLITDY